MRKANWGDTILSLYADEQKRTSLAQNVSKMAKPDATGKIVDEIFKLIK